MMNFSQFPELSHYLSTVADGNIGFHKSDSEALRARERIAQKMGFTVEQIVAMKQTHTKNVRIVNSGDKGAGSMMSENAIAGTDGLITREKGVVLLAQSADCPLGLFYDQKKKILGVAHSGWRGTLAGMFEEMIQAMAQTFHSDPNTIFVGITPSAGKCCYEIGKDVADLFARKFSESAIEVRNDKLYLDLRFVLKNQLVNAGILENHLEISETCSICSPDYFSYRRQQEQAGRIGLFAWLI